MYNKFYSYLALPPRSPPLSSYKHKSLDYAFQRQIIDHWLHRKDAMLEKTWFFSKSKILYAKVDLNKMSINSRSKNIWFIFSCLGL